MRVYFEEIIILILQLLIFYAFPIFAVENEFMGIVVIVLIATFMVALVFGAICKTKFKYYYPVIISLFFIPAVSIYSNEYTLIHSFWCLGTTFIGVILGNRIMNK